MKLISETFENGGPKGPVHEPVYKTTSPVPLADPRTFASGPPHEAFERLRRAVPVLGLKAPVRGSSARDVAQAALAMSRQGLKDRARLNANGDDETIFLTELDDIAATGVTPAERLLERWRTEWKGDIDPVFEACAY